ncbi:MAG: hypothetical protein NC824_02835, partial [Candidatus Omnitrophica bacterium]|nr:hypothetical protein [Candidatus Omnitrophota bacterium]
YPGHPRAKGKIERMFRFIEGRFVEEVRKMATRLGISQRDFYSGDTLSETRHFIFETTIPV